MLGGYAQPSNCLYTQAAEHIIPRRLEPAVPNGSLQLLL